MKKFFKFLGGLTSLAAVGFGAYCVYKKITDKTKDIDDEDEFEDLFEDEDLEESKSGREYVSINITGEELSEKKPVEESTTASEVAEETAADAE